MSTAQELAEKVIEEEMEDWVLQMAKRLVEEKIATWEFDPQHDKVVGLIARADNSYPRREALVVVYLEDSDVELGLSFEHLARDY